VPTIPIAGLALILGVDRFLAEIRTATNFIGNGVAAIVVSRWEGELDSARLAQELRGTRGPVEAKTEERVSSEA
jgi:aerobic C4-dicarboxylate transport protein